MKNCLQFLIIKVNENSIAEKQSKIKSSIREAEHPKVNTNNVTRIKDSLRSTSYRASPDLKSPKQQPLTSNTELSPIVDQVFSPVQDQVSSTQDQILPELEDENLLEDEEVRNIPSVKMEQMVTISNDDQSPSSKRHKRLIDSIDEDNFSASHSSPSYVSANSPLSTSSSISSDCSDDSMSSSTSSSSSSYCSSSSTNSSSSRHLTATIFETNSELRTPRLKLSEDKIRKIRRRPISFDDNYLERSSFASTPTTSSDCSPSRNSDIPRLCLGLNTTVMHSFQAPPQFVNNLKPCNFPIKKQESQPNPSTPTVTTKEMLNCAICGIKEKPSNISRIYGQNSCPLCTRFFATFLKRPQQLYCGQDGDCLMTFDSRCQACWIKICLQKFHVEEENRRIGQKYSPKLLSSPNVSLITIDTSLPRQ